MITVHHLENSRSQRVLWLLEELALPYEVQRYARDKKTSLAPPELLQVHPLGKSPVITDGGITVAETGAIVEYLVDQAGGALRPEPGSADHRRYTYWLHFAEGTAMPPLVMALVFNKIKGAPMPFFVKPIANAIADKVMHGFVQPNLDRNRAFNGERAQQPRLVCRPRILGRRRDDQFPGRGRAVARWRCNPGAEAGGLSRTRARAASLAAGAGAGWALQAAGLKLCPMVRHWRMMAPAPFHRPVDPETPCIR